MQGFALRLLALGLAAVAATGVNAADLDDATWISRYMAANRPAAAAAPTRGRSIGFAELSNHVGADVRVILSDGRLRRGRVVRADGRRMRLRVELPSGYAHLDLDPARVRSLTLE